MPGAFPPVAYITSAGLSRLREWQAAEPGQAEAGPSRPLSSLDADAGDRAPAPGRRRGLGAPPPPAYPGHVPPPVPRRETPAELVGWHANLSGHGRGPRGPPAFVPAQSSYDELGRVVADGVGVEVIGGESEVAADEVEKMGGDEVKSWYEEVGARVAQAGRAELDQRRRADKPRRPARAPPDPADIIELLDSDSDDGGVELLDETATHAGRRPAAGRGSPRTLPRASAASEGLAPRASPAAAPVSVPPDPPLRVHTSEWFIRRALLSAHRAAAANTPAGPPLRSNPDMPAAPAAFASISSLLDLPPSSARPPPRPVYAIGPDNPGYVRLRELGWAGGGLGRPVGWDDGAAQSASAAVGGAQASGRPGDTASTETDPADPEAAVTAGHGVDAPDGIVDLTLDSDSDGDFSDAPSDEAAPAGPGRTAPLPVLLKLDRLGLGHRKAGARRVTHTHAQVEAARRRARGVRAPSPAADGGETGKQGMPGKRERVRWKAREKREREERARIARAVNA